MTKWKIIETAPKDTDVLIFVPCVVFQEVKVGHCTLTHWHAVDDRDWVNTMSLEPTHWMPLPSKPTTSKVTWGDLDQIAIPKYYKEVLNNEGLLSPPYLIEGQDPIYRVGIHQGDRVYFNYEFNYKGLLWSTSDVLYYSDLIVPPYEKIDELVKNFKSSCDRRIEEQDAKHDDNT